MSVYKSYIHRYYEVIFRQGSMVFDHKVCLIRNGNTIIYFNSLDVPLAQFQFNREYLCLQSIKECRRRLSRAITAWIAERKNLGQYNLSYSVIEFKASVNRPIF